MKKILTILLVMLVFVAANAQQATNLKLTFTGKTNFNDYIKLDSIQVLNMDRNWTETLVYPDTVLRLTVNVGVNDYEHQVVGQNYPNPFSGTTDVQVSVPKAGLVNVQVFDISGKLCLSYKDKMDAGVYAFDVTLATPQTYLLKVTTDYATQSVKMVNMGKGAGNTIRFKGMQGSLGINLTKHDCSHPFQLKDAMKYIGYAGEYVSEPISQAQEASEYLTLIFTVPDPALLPTVTTDSFSDVTDASVKFTGTVLTDGGAEVIERGFCWSVNPSPNIAGKHLAFGSGLGQFEGTITGLESSTTYYVRAYATNRAGTSYGEDILIYTAMGSCGNMTIKDYDGNIYHTVKMGDQCWLRENLRTKHFSDGKEINEIKKIGDAVPGYFVPDDCVECENNLYKIYPEIFGLLYNYAAVMNGEECNNYVPSNVQGICPEGWHVPSASEWDIMLKYVDSQQENLCDDEDFGGKGTYAKSIAHQIGWTCSSIACSPGNISEDNDITTFGFVGVGYLRESNGNLEFRDVSLKGQCWTATKDDKTGNPIYYYLEYDKPSAYLNSDLKVENAMSVRCVQTQIQ